MTSTDWLIHWLIDPLTDWSIDWLIDWNNRTQGSIFWEVWYHWINNKSIILCCKTKYTGFQTLSLFFHYTRTIHEYLSKQKLDVGSHWQVLDKKLFKLNLRWVCQSNYNINIYSTYNYYDVLLIYIVCTIILPHL